MTKTNVQILDISFLGYYSTYYVNGTARLNFEDTRQTFSQHASYGPRKNKESSELLEKPENKKSGADVGPISA